MVESIRTAIVISGFDYAFIDSVGANPHVLGIDHVFALQLLTKLPASLEYWHFGDSDPEGFDILRDLRERTYRPFRSFRMNWRPQDDSPELDVLDRHLIEKLQILPIMSEERPALATMLANGRKGRFEQESLGLPNNSVWPFYS